MSATQIRTTLLQNLSPFLSDVQAMQQINAFVVQLRMPSSAQHKTGMELAMEDIEAGRVHHYNSLDELKAKFAHVYDKRLTLLLTETGTHADLFG